MALAAIPAHAQTDTSQDEDATNDGNVIIVTAQKRGEALSDVPVAISAVSGETLEQASIASVTELIPYVPGLSGSAQGIATNVWNIRGIGTNDFTVGSEPAVAVFQDDAYVGRNVLATAALFDVERIEVVKGPQGTLFGRNASAGAINVITRKPEYSNYAQLGAGIGNDSQNDFTFIGNIALSDSVRMRLAYVHEDFRGISFAQGVDEDYFVDSDSVRLTVAIEPSPTTEILLMGQYTDAQGNQVRQHNAGFAGLIGLPGGGDPFADVTTADSPSFERPETRGVNLRVTHEFDNGMTLTSISDWRSWDYAYSQDLDGIGLAIPIDLGDAFFGLPGAIVTFGSPVFFQPDVHADTLSQELRLNGSNGPVDWFFGGSYFRENVREEAFVAWPTNFDGDALLGGGGVFPVLTEANPASYRTRGHYESFAVFGDATVELTDGLSLSGGLRWTKDNKDFCSANVDPTFGFLQLLGPDSGGQSICGTANSDKLTYRVVADVKVTDEVLLYGSYATGYKGGGFNSSLVGSGPFGIDPPFTVLSFRPETSRSIEFGAKADWGDLQTNVAVYFTDYEDLQLLDNSIALRITNLAQVSSDGLEFDLTWTPAAADGLTIAANYAYNDNRIDAPGRAIDGSQLSIAPENTFAVLAQYEHGLGGLGTLTWFAGYTWQDDVLFDVNGARVPQPSYGLADASLTFTPNSERFDITFSAKNLFDEEYLAAASDPLQLGFPISLRGRPFQFKATLNIYFGDR